MYVCKKYFVYFTHLPRSPNGQICNKLGTDVWAADVVTCNKYFGDWLRGVDSVRVENCNLPLTKKVAINTGLALTRSL